MKILMLASWLCFFTLSSFGIDTNAVYGIYLAASYTYHVHFSGSKNDSASHLMTIAVLWHGIGDSGHQEKYEATIENFPFIRVNWAIKNMGNDHVDEFGEHIAFTPIFPIQGRIRILSANDRYDVNGNPVSHIIKYRWVTNPAP